MRNKWSETGVIVCDRNVRNQNMYSTFPQSLMIWGCMSGKGTIAVITSSINAQVYVNILDTFLIPSIERIHIGSLPWPANNPVLNPIENLCVQLCSHQWIPKL
uniref:Uncharacterized protein n=1 Tax=Gouania willdenowi TaxID=441366 RepID=A0A8C5DZE9_GOUWI